MANLEYLTDPTGQPKAVVIPIEVWRKVFPQKDLKKVIIEWALFLKATL